MWLYLNKNQDNYRFALSQKACEEWGIKKDSYYDGIKDLITHGYLRQSQPGSNLYFFYENALAENQKIEDSKFYLTENTKPTTEIQNRKYENQNRMAVNPERNNINNTRIIKDNKASSFGRGEAESWRYKMGL